MPHELPQEEAVVDRAVGLEVIDVGEAEDVDVQRGLSQDREGVAGPDEQCEGERKKADRDLLSGSPSKGTTGTVTRET
jgi:hypothetical protein